MTVQDNFRAVEEQPHENYLHGKFADFFFLGGGSLPVLALIALLPPEQYQPQVLLSVWIISVFINHPHFIHSYQIFYDGFLKKIAEGAALRRRYLFAGVIVPAAMLLFFAWSILTADAALLAKSAYVMLFLVGWHYTKQGYGILIVESVLKKAFFSEFEKRWLRYNALAVWLSSWMYFNQRLGQRELWGTEYFLLGIPGWVVQIAVSVCVATSLLALAILVRKQLYGKLPINGVIAYVSASYVWLVLSSISVLAVMLVPAFHSLQYLAVVWRYQSNKTRALDQGRGDRLFELVGTSEATAAMIRFILFGTFVGTLGFYLVPFALDTAIAYREDIFGPTMFLFTFSLFINVHHYFLDNVMWRKENADVKEFLLG